MSSQARIRLARRHARLSQVQLAREVGVQRSAVSHWEAREGRHPSMAHLRRIAEVTGVQFEWLATGRGRMALTEDVALDSVAAADALLVEDALEMRLLRAFRDAPPPSRIALIEIIEQLATLRTGRTPRGVRGSAGESA